VVELLVAECGLTPAAVVADIGSGTGILTRLLLERGCRVHGVEPNREMREAGDRLLAAYPSFTSVAAAAEETTLPAASIDIVTAGQAFHWFDRPRARAEFGRILKPGGWVALIWNARRTTSTPFLAEYERFLHTYGTDYAAVDHTNIGPEILRAFFGADGYRTAQFDNQQRFDFEGLRGRLLSSSYTPEPSDPRHAPMLAELERLFAAHAVDGLVAIDYDTSVQYGHLTPEREIT
jgi:ubiquinone/menaquinone biosynthesis C-methylase UbiE